MLDLSVQVLVTRLEEGFSVYIPNLCRPTFMPGHSNTTNFFMHIYGGLHVVRIYSNLIVGFKCVSTYCISLHALIIIVVTCVASWFFHERPYRF